MSNKESHKHIKLAKELRNRQTDVEAKLWRELRSRQLGGCKFRRQHPIGDYIVDFVCLDKRIIIELDGGQHNIEHVIEKDKQRQEWLESEGFRVLRFWDNDVIENVEGIADKIMEYFDSPSSSFSPQGRRKV